MRNSQKCIIFVLSNKEIINNMDKKELLKYWAGELLAVKMELRKIGFILESGIRPPRKIEQALDDLLDRKRNLEKLIEELSKKK